MADFFSIAPGTTYARRLTATGTGANSATAQPWFPSTGTITLSGGRNYWIRGAMWLNHGTTSHTTAISLGGTATYSSVYLTARHHVLSPNNTATGGNTTLVTQSASTVISAAVTTANEWFEVDGLISINAAGTLIPQFTFSADPTGTIAIGTNTHWFMYDIGANTETTKGDWS